MKDTLKGRPIYRVEEFANGVLTAPDGRPVEAISYYTDAAPPVDGRPIDAVSKVLGEGEFIYAVSAYPAGTLVTPDGRPVSASVLCDASGTPGASFNPMTMTPSMWVDASDMTTLFQDSAGSVPVAAAADPVGQFGDKSGNGRHLLQATATMRPTLRQTSGKNSIECDGVDDGLLTASGAAWGALVDVFLVASNPAGDTNFVGIGSSVDSGFLFAATSGSAADSSDGSGSQPFVNNTLSTTRGSNHAALAGGGPKVIEWRGVNMTAFFGAMIGKYSGFEFAGRYHEIMICPAQSAAVRTQYRDYLIAKWGVV